MPPPSSTPIPRSAPLAALIRSLVLLAAITAPFHNAGAQSAPDEYTIVTDNADETTAIRSRSIVRNGDTVRFQLVSYESEPEQVEFRGHPTVVTQFILMELEMNCKGYQTRMVRYGAMSLPDLTVAHSEAVEDEFAGGGIPIGFLHACAKDPSRTSRRSFPDPASFARAAPGLRRDAIARAAERAKEPPPEPSSGLTIDGVDPADCVTPERRQRAAQGVLTSSIENADRMTPEMLATARLQHVNSACMAAMLLQGQDPATNPDIAPTRSWYAVDHHECRAEWNGKCQADIVLTVPEGFQICTVKYAQDGRGYEHEVELIPTDWIDDGSSPSKFRTYLMRLTANGGYRVFNKTSASIKVSNVWVTFFSARLDNRQRRERGCNMPDKPAPPRPPEPDPAVPLGRPEFGFPRTANSERFRWVIAAPANAQSRVMVKVEVFDAFVDNRWEVFREGEVILPPNTITDIEEHKYHATCWSFTSSYLTATGWQPGPRHAQKCQ